jgi:hypothetical protein
VRFTASTMKPDGPCHHDHPDLIHLAILPGHGKERPGLGICMICPREHRYRDLPLPTETPECYGQ